MPVEKVYRAYITISLIGVLLKYGVGYLGNIISWLTYPNNIFSSGTSVHTSTHMHPPVPTYDVLTQFNCNAIKLQLSLFRLIQHSLTSSATALFNSTQFHLTSVLFCLCIIHILHYDANNLIRLTRSRYILLCVCVTCLLPCHISMRLRVRMCVGVRMLSYSTKVNRRSQFLRLKAWNQYKTNELQKKKMLKIKWITSTQLSSSVRAAICAVKMATSLFYFLQQRICNSINEVNKSVATTLMYVCRYIHI